MAQSLMIPVGLLVIAGAAIAVQAPLNATLSRSIGSPLAAAAWSFGVGFILLAALALMSSGSAPILRLTGVPVWQLVGGILGAYYVWSVISGVQSVGIFTAMAALIFGQVVTALAIDQVGAFGLAVQPITPQRVLAAAMVAGGLILSRL